MNERNNDGGGNHRRHKKDSADLFREQNLGAIEKRKRIKKIILWIMIAVAVVTTTIALLLYLK